MRFGMAVAFNEEQRDDGGNTAATENTISRRFLSLNFKSFEAIFFVKWKS